MFLILRPGGRNQYCFSWGGRTIFAFNEGISIDFVLCAGRTITDLTMAVTCCGSGVNIKMGLISVFGPKVACVKHAD